MIVIQFGHAELLNDALVIHKANHAKEMKAKRAKENIEKGAFPRSVTLCNLINAIFYVVSKNQR